MCLWSLRDPCFLPLKVSSEGGHWERTATKMWGVGWAFCDAMKTRSINGDASISFHGSPCHHHICWPSRSPNILLKNPNPQKRVQYWHLHTFQSAANISHRSTDMWSVLIVIKEEWKEGQVHYQLGKSGRERPEVITVWGCKDRSFLSQAAAWCWTAVERGPHFLCPNPQNKLFSRRGDDFLQGRSWTQHIVHAHPLSCVTQSVCVEVKPFIQNISFLWLLHFMRMHCSFWGDMNELRP